jgi:hypothetical protein
MFETCVYNRIAMELLFNLHWLRESGHDNGTPVRADELDPAIRDRVLLAAQGAEGELALKLPFLDLREIRRRSEVLGELEFKRCGNEVVPLLTPRFALRTAAADVAMAHPAWIKAPTAQESNYFRTWQGVSNALQSHLRKRIAEEYFRDPQAYVDRDAAYPMIVYQTARVYHGNPPNDFTYDLRDYPDCRDTLESTWKTIGFAIQRALTEIEQRLYEAGMPALARRYAPRWFEDILLEVRRKPKTFHKLMAVESDLIDSVIELGMSRTAEAVCRFAKIANLRYKNLHGKDFRAQAIEALPVATGALCGGRG